MADIAAHDSMRKVPAHIVVEMARYHAHLIEYSSTWFHQSFKPESPIEAALGFALLHLEDSVGLTPPPEDGWAGPDYSAKLAFACPQQNILGYRVDFLVTTASKKCFVVECDGHDFHERTKAQAARDRKRDRTFANAGIHVLRFTGSEIWSDVIGCAKSVIRFAELLEWDQLGEDS